MVIVSTLLFAKLLCVEKKHHSDIVGSETRCIFTKIIEINAPKAAAIINGHIHVVAKF